jgi:hypothetical protein
VVTAPRRHPGPIGGFTSKQPQSRYKAGAKSMSDPKNQMKTLPNEQLDILQQLMVRLIDACATYDAAINHIRPNITIFVEVEPKNKAIVLEEIENDANIICQAHTTIHDLLPKITTAGQAIQGILNHKKYKVSKKTKDGFWPLVLAQYEEFKKLNDRFTQPGAQDQVIFVKDMVAQYKKSLNQL